MVLTTILAVVKIVVRMVFEGAARRCSSKRSLAGMTAIVTGASAGRCPVFEGLRGFPFALTWLFLYYVLVSCVSSVCCFCVMNISSELTWLLYYCYDYNVNVGFGG